MPEGHLQCRSPLAVDSKADTSPVTEADRQAEAAMKALILESFPSHDSFGEESGMEPGKQPEGNTDPKYLWVIDPIDGTKSFITGVPAPMNCTGTYQGGAAFIMQQGWHLGLSLPEKPDVPLYESCCS